MPGGKKDEITRVERRRALIKGRIMEDSSRMFSKLGFDAVKFEDIANAADVARGTLYSFFKNKEALVEEILRTVYQKVIQGLDKVKFSDPVKNIEALLNLYCDIWETNSNQMVVASAAAFSSQGRSEKLRKELFSRIENIFQSAAGWGILRSGNPAVTTELFSRTSVPSLEVLSKEKDYRKLFVDHIKHLLLMEKK